MSSNKVSSIDTKRERKLDSIEDIVADIKSGKAVWLVAALSLGVYAMRMLMFTRGREGTQS